MVMVVVMPPVEMPDDAANDPMVVVMVMMMEAAMMMMHAGELHVAGHLTDALFLRRGCHYRVRSAQRRYRVWDWGEQLGE
jgi:hypothetical protein